ncbi:MAG: acetate--CoA ligase family protein [Sphaerochaetaceae bacterium]
MDVKKLLKPNRVAVVGASEKEGFGGDTCRNIMKYMKPEDYYFVNPKRDQVFGIKCYPTLSDLPEDVELLVITTPKPTVEALLVEGAKKGAKGAVVFASGYGEMGTPEGEAAEESLKAICQELDIALMGPNCAGYANYMDMIYPYAFISNERDRKGSVGVVSQSGQLVLSMMEAQSIKFSYAISSGNGKITTIEDYLEFLVEDQDTKVIALYMEGSKNPKKLAQTLKRAALVRKPIVVLKTGRSDKGQALAASHTGSLSGSDRVFDALFEKFGVIRVDDLEELMSTAQAFAVLDKLPETEGVSSISLSGGETGICADLGHLVGLDYPDFTSGTQKKLEAILPGYATVNNPLDSTATLSYDTDKFASVCETIMKDPSVGIVAIGYTLLQEIADNAIYYMSEGLAKVMKESWAKPCVMVPFAENTRNGKYVRKLEEIGVAVLPTSLYALKVIKNIVRFSAYKVEEHNLDLAILGEMDVENEGVHGEAEKVLTESQSKELISSYGIPCSRSKVVKSSEDAGKAFEDLGLKKAVAKVDSPDILHKSDAGCVILNIGSEREAMIAYDKIIANANSYMENPRINGVQICDMVEKGTEVILGVNNDPQFGPVVLVGMGGVFVEIFKDTSMAMAPVSLEEADKMLKGLKSFPLLEGYRGGAKGDIKALADTIVKVSELAVDHAGSLKELDINPIFVYEKGICAVDALYIRK